MKSNNVVNFLVFRYLRFDKTQPFISVTALLAFIGVAIGVMVLIVAMAIMNGFDKEFEKKLFVMNYPLTIYPKGNFRVNNELLKTLEKELPELKLSPYLSSQAVARKGDTILGAMVFGVDFIREVEVNEIVKEFSKDVEFSEFDALLGDELSKGLYLSNGEKFTFIFTDLSAGGLSVMPTIKRFSQANSFKSGLNAYDKSYVFVRLEDLARVLNVKEGSYDGIHV